jgi:predicted DNA binding protein
MMDLKLLRLDYNPPDILEIGYGDIFEKVKEITIITSLMQTFERFILVCEVVWKGEPDVEHLKNLMMVENAEEVSRDRNTSLAIVSGQFPDVYREVIRNFFDTFHCFIEFPARLTLKTLTGSIVGTQENLNRFLSFTKTWGAEYNIISIKKYQPRVEGALSALTSKQYMCLETAVRLGYFDVPRKTHSRELASELNLSHATVLEHMKKGQRSIFTALFKE